MVPCVTTKEMKEAEELAFQKGISSKQLIRSVAHGIATHFEFQKRIHDTNRPILLLVGKGLNGLDGLALGCNLLLQKKEVQAYVLPQHSSSPLFDYFIKEFCTLGGSFVTKEAIQPGIFSHIIDALLGTGNRAIQDETMHETILLANKTHTPIISIDIPSGIDPDTGEIFDIAIRAECTFACQCPKIGSFLQSAWGYVGELYSIDIGLVPPHSLWSYITLLDAKALIPSIERTTYKYKRGTVSLYTGSKEMIGASVLASKAAFLSGAGYVRAFTKKEAYEASLALPIEAVRVFYDIHNSTTFVIPDKGALIIGPGLGRSQDIEHLVSYVLHNNTLPCVIDGDALYYLPSIPLPNAILTPHKGEAKNLLNTSFDNLSSTQIDSISSYAKRMECSIILKGSPTFIFTKEGKIFIMGFGTPALATAGTGDILSGILGALLSQGLSQEAAAILGTTLHALAGREASRMKTEHSVMASHVVEAIPTAFLQLLSYTEVKENNSQ